MRQGVSLRMCQNALKAFGVDEASLWEGVQTVSGGITELCRLQQEGYSYIKP
jgi:intracellular sulfur oxidation DsrE/DsrF family protein